MNPISRFNDYFVPPLPHRLFGKTVTPVQRERNNAWLRQYGERYAVRWARLALSIFVAAFVVRSATPLYLIVGFLGLGAGAVLVTLNWLIWTAERE